MNRYLLAIVAVLLIAVTLGIAQDQINRQERRREMVRGAQPDQRDVHYGDAEKEPWRVLDVYDAEGDGPRPVYLFVHGGGWTIGDKRVGRTTAQSFLDNGITFVSVGYRLEGKDGDDIPWPGNAEDIAAAIGFVIDHAESLNIDPARVTIAGHSAGAHLVAIVAADASFLNAVGHSPDELWSLVAIDGAGYDLAARQRSLEGPMVRRLYAKAFGEDPDVLKAASPLHATQQAAETESAICPRWLIMHAGDREVAEQQGKALRDAVITAGAKAITMHNPDEDHGEAHRSLANADDPELLAILKLIDTGELPDQDDAPE